MPPKVKITKNDIIKTSLELVRANGSAAINARNIASALSCSTQPIFSNFESMEKLEKSILHAAYEKYLGFIAAETTSGKYPQYKAYGMAYVRFAKEEKELFKLLFMRDRTDEDKSPSPDFEESVKIIMKANNISFEKASLMHLETWTFVHGIGTMLATSFLPLELDLISDMLSDIYQGLRTRLLKEEN